MTASAVFALGLAAVLCGPAGAQNLRETIVAELADSSLIEGNLDWAGQSLVVYGEGAAPAGLTDPVRRRLLGFRAAKVTAYRNLLEIVGRVHVDSRTTVTMAMVAGDSIRQRVEGVVRGARVVPGSRQEEEGLYRLAVQLDLLGDLTAAVLPGGDGGAAALEEPGHDLPAALPESDSLLVFVPSRPYSGLVIDARGTGLRPTMAPRIVDESGRVIYSADHVNREYAVEFGVAGYHSDIQAAAASDRLGGEEAHALIVPALTSTGLFGGDAVVERDAGIRVLMADAESRFLSECRVVFVVGQHPDPIDPAHPGQAVADSLGHLRDIITGGADAAGSGFLENAEPATPSGDVDP